MLVGATQSFTLVNLIQLELMMRGAEPQANPVMQFPRDAAPFVDLRFVDLVEKVSGVDHETFLEAGRGIPVEGADGQSQRPADVPSEAEPLYQVLECDIYQKSTGPRTVLQFDLAGGFRERALPDQHVASLVDPNLSRSQAVDDVAPHLARLSGSVLPGHGIPGLGAAQVI
jgi:hypothetical protein